MAALNLSVNHVTDAASSCNISSSPVGGNSTALPGSSCPSMLSTTSAPEQGSRVLGAPLEEGGPGGPGGSGLGVEAALGAAGDSSGGAQPSQITPSKRRTVLNISPPPEDLLDDSRMSCQEEAPLPDSEQSGSMWMEESLSSFSMASSSSYNDNTEVPRKSRKRTPRQRPGSKPAAAQAPSMEVFDADSANAPHFVLSQLGSDAKASPKGRWVYLHDCITDSGDMKHVCFPPLHTHTNTHHKPLQ